MSKVLDDINGGGTSGQDTVAFYQPEHLPRARAKRMGLPVDPNPHDHTKERDATQTGGDKLPVWNPFFEKEQQEYVDNGDHNDRNDSSNKSPRGEGFYDWYADEVRKEYEQMAKDREAEEKRLKRQKRFSVIGDGLSAMHEAYSYGRGIEPIAPPTSLSAKWRERYDKLRDDRHKSNMEYLNAMSKLENIRDNVDYRNETMQYKKDALDLRKKEEERRVNVAKAQIEYTLARTDAIKSKEDIDERIAEAKIALMNAGVEEKKANAEAKRIVSQSQAYKNYAQAKNGGSSGGGRMSDYTTKEDVVYDNRGRVVTRTKTRTANGHTTTTTKKANPMGGSTGSKRNPMS